MQTVANFQKQSGTPIKTKSQITEAAHKRHPKRAARVIEQLFEKDYSVALCTHRPLLPDVLGHLAERAVAGSAARRTLSALATAGIDKGEVLVCQVSGAGDEAVVVTVERHRP